MRTGDDRRAEQRGRRALAGAMVAALLLGGLLAGTAGAVVTPEQKCQADRLKAGGKYAHCVQKVIATYWTTGDYTAFREVVGKCATRYAATWLKLRTRADGTEATCDDDRFATGVPGTVIDLLTGLQWEQKTTLVESGENYGDPHDVDNDYTWSTSGEAADGAAFASFLLALNSGACFAGQCDWRLPTLEELLTIATPAFPNCIAEPCIDPVFGVTLSLFYVSSSTYPMDPGLAWGVDFGDNGVDGLNKAADLSVRAVRGGL